MKLFQHKRVLTVGAVGSVVAAAFLGGRVWAAGVPATGALTYSGTLEDAAGTPLSGAHDIQVAFWDGATGGAAPVCQSASTQIELQPQGRFTIGLPDTCATAVHGNPDLWAEVIADGLSLGRSKLGAVPYALEAAESTHAVSATQAESAIQATSAESASHAESAAEADTATYADSAGEADSATLADSATRGAVKLDGTSMVPARVCSGATTPGDTSWEPYVTTSTGAISPSILQLQVDISACGFTEAPTVVSSLAGDLQHFATMGGSEPYGVDESGFVTYVLRASEATVTMTPEAANDRRWHINWIAVGN